MRSFSRDLNVLILLVTACQSVASLLNTLSPPALDLPFAHSLLGGWRCRYCPWDLRQRRQGFPVACVFGTLRSRLLHGLFSKMRVLNWFRFGLFVVDQGPS